MSHRPGDEEQAIKALFAALAANQAAFGQLVAYGNFRLQQEESELHMMATRALLDPAERDKAVLQYGRVSLLQDLMQEARKYLK